MEGGAFPERPIRAAEFNGRAAHGANARRQPRETMADYDPRQKTGWDDLRKASPGTCVGEDIRAT